MYVEHADNIRRRSIQTVLFNVVDILSRLIAPVLSFTCEEIYQEIPNYAKKEQSVFLSGFPKYNEKMENDDLINSFAKLDKIRTEVQKELEKARQNKEIGQNLDAKIEIVLPESINFEIFNKKGEIYKDYLYEIALFFIVSQVKIVEKADDSFIKTDIDGLFVKVGKADGLKCERCWTYSTEIGKDEEYKDACPRCISVLKKHNH